MAAPIRVSSSSASPRPERRRPRCALGLSYPREVFSLFHIALPFPTSDALYGMDPDPAEDFGVNLGALAVRGERGTLIVNQDPHVLQPIPSVHARANRGGHGGRAGTGLAGARALTGQRMQMPSTHVPSARRHEHGRPGGTVNGMRQMPSAVEQTRMIGYGKSSGNKSYRGTSGNCWPATGILSAMATSDAMAMIRPMTGFLPVRIHVCNVFLVERARPEHLPSPAPGGEESENDREICGHGRSATRAGG